MLHFSNSRQYTETPYVRQASLHLHARAITLGGSGIYTSDGDEKNVAGAPQRRRTKA